ncbi:MAG: carboxypeptidase-like regulatory domain-containing protein, partial [Thermoanaerobaculia bacterium]
MLPQKTSRCAPFIIALILFAFVCSSVGHAQSGAQITGTVTDATNGSPLAGARISVTGSVRGAVTGDDGQYRIDVPGGVDYTLTASLLGREPVSEVVHLTRAARITANFSLKPGSILLSDVVVSASRSPQSPREVAATVNVMSREQIRTNPARTTDDLLREMPGVELP